MSTIHQQGGKFWLFKMWPLSRMAGPYTTLGQAVEAQQKLEGGDVIDGGSRKVVVYGAHRADGTSAEKLNAVPITKGEAMSAKTIFEQIFGFALLAGEQLAPIVIHNPRSQQFVTVLTPDVNALFQLLESQGAMAPAAPTPPAA